MIAFGCAVGEEEPYWRYTEPGIRLAAEADSEIYAFAAVTSTARSYNLLIDAAAARDDLEALVILHSHAQIADPGLCATVRRALGDPDVAVVGCAGARGASSIAWWEGEVVSAPITQRYHEYGGGDLAAYSWTSPAAPPAEVDTVAGILMVLSPWAVRNVRFDEELVLGAGIEVDLCRTVRAAGRKVVVADLPVLFHRSIEVIEHRQVWVEAHMRIAAKWEPRLTGVDPADVDWKARARRAEAERESAHAAAYAYGLMADARVVELERELAALTSSASWRWTEPLRWFNAWRSDRGRPKRALPRRSAP